MRVTEIVLNMYKEVKEHLNYKKLSLRNRLEIDLRYNNMYWPYTEEHIMETHDYFIQVLKRLEDMDKIYPYKNKKKKVVRFEL